VAANDSADPLAGFHATRRPFDDVGSSAGASANIGVPCMPSDDASRSEDGFTPAWASERPSADNMQGARVGELQEAGDLLGVKIRIIRIFRSRGDVAKHVPAILELLDTSTTNVRRKRQLHLEMTEQAKRYCLPADVTAKLERTVRLSVPGDDSERA
jgi:hypothetical protein